MSQLTGQRDEGVTPAGTPLTQVLRDQSGIAGYLREPLECRGIDHFLCGEKSTPRDALVVLKGRR